MSLHGAFQRMQLVPVEPPTLAASCLPLDVSAAVLFSHLRNVLDFCRQIHHMRFMLSPSGRRVSWPCDKIDREEGTRRIDRSP
jgi:hypothetical protein